jgi:peroxiredoxin
VRAGDGDEKLRGYERGRELAKRAAELKGLANVVAISTDEASESKKLDHLLDKAFPLLSDPDLKVINAFQMRHNMGGVTVGNMGYAIIDGRGVVRKTEVDPLFGRHAEVILGSLRKLQ